MSWICRQIYATAERTYNYYWMSLLNFYDLKPQLHFLCKAKYINRVISISINQRGKNVMLNQICRDVMKFGHILA